MQDSDDDSPEALGSESAPSSTANASVHPTSLAEIVLFSCWYSSSCLDDLACLPPPLVHLGTVAGEPRALALPVARQACLR